MGPQAAQTPGPPSGPPPRWLRAPRSRWPSPGLGPSRARCLAQRRSDPPPRRPAQTLHLQAGRLHAPLAPRRLPRPCRGRRRERPPPGIAPACGRAGRGHPWWALAWSPASAADRAVPDPEEAEALPSAEPSWVGPAVDAAPLLLGPPPEESPFEAALRLPPCRVARGLAHHAHHQDAGRGLRVQRVRRLWSLPTTRQSGTGRARAGRCA